MPSTESTSKNTSKMPATTKYSRNDRQELTGLARNLRRAKRQMFLKEVEAPQTSVESFRELVTTSVMSEVIEEYLSSSSFEFTEKKLTDSPNKRDTSLKSDVHQVQEGSRAAWRSFFHRLWSLMLSTYKLYEMNTLLICILCHHSMGTQVPNVIARRSRSRPLDSRYDEWAHLFFHIIYTRTVLDLHMNTLKLLHNSLLKTSYHLFQSS